MRILITGGSGDLGRPLSARAAVRWQTFAGYCRNPHIGGGRAVPFDLRDEATVRRIVAELHPDVIIHAAVSDRTPDMEATNRDAAANIGAAAQQVGARLIALSTDMVFDGTAPPYTEESPPTPASPYGRVKAENERFLLNTVDDCLIVRTSLIYDFDPSNRQLAWMQATIAAGKPVPLFSDERRHPIWVWNLADALLELAATSDRGILHVAGPRAMSRYEYGSALLAAMGYEPEKVVKEVRAADVLPSRPRDLTLVLEKAHSRLKTPLLDIQEAVQRRADHTDQGQRSRTTTKR